MWSYIVYSDVVVLCAFRVGDVDIGPKDDPSLGDLFQQTLGIFRVVMLKLKIA